MLVQLKQINNADLASFILQTISGGAFSGNMASYYNNTGYFGSYVLVSTGGIQNVNTQFIFSVSPEVPYTPFDTGSAVNQLYVINSINSGLAIQFLQLTGNTVSLSGNDIILGAKTFTGQLNLQQLATLPNHAVSLAILTGVSGALAVQAGAVNVVNLTSNQLITGIKSFVSIPNSFGTPVNPTDLATKQYVDSNGGGGGGGSAGTNVVTTSGLNQNLSGTYNYSNLLTVPIATNPNSPAQLAQLEALGVVMGGITGFGGVASINGTSGASGNIFLVGAGNVQIIQCGPLFYVSGNQGFTSTQIYSSKIPLAAGVTGLQINFSTGFQGAVNPVVVGTIETSGGGNLSFIQSQIYNVSTGGFNVALSSGIPNGTPNYFYDFTANPLISGSGGFLAIQGVQGLLGPSLNPRGIWQQAQVYSVYDLVYNPPYNASYVCYVGNVSSPANAPGGTGNSNWAIYSSGAQGATGLWNAFYPWSTGQIFAYGNTTYYNGSAYGYTGAIPESGAPPNTGFFWTLIASQGGIGYFINSGVITGNFVNLSFYLNPVNTGLNLAEAFVANTFMVTGYALGCWASGTGISQGGYPGPLSGDFYTRDLNNNKVILQNFTFNTGINSATSSILSLPVTGYYRIGVDITNTLGGIQGLSLGIFGFGLPL